MNSEAPKLIEVNLIIINGMGGAATSQPIHHLRNRILARFGRTIYCPPPVNYKETGLLLRYLDEWKDPTIFAALSCGCTTINEVMEHAPKNERVPFAIYYSPSIYCGIIQSPVPPQIERVQEVNSWSLDWFNPGSPQRVKPDTRNNTTKFNAPMKSGMAHGYTPNYRPAEIMLVTEISAAQEGTKNV